MLLFVEKFYFGMFVNCLFVKLFDGVFVGLVVVGFSVFIGVGLLG